MKPLFSERARKILIRSLLALLGVLVVTGGVGGAWFWSRLHASLPMLEGELELADLSAPVVIERDALGVPTLRAANRLDAARATGFLHAQERFFQMDLLRRSAAGELAELIGAAGLPFDRSMRVHRFRQRARVAFAALPADHQAIARAYAEGVNAGLGALAAPPFEYLALRADPAPWADEDTLLPVYAMYRDLQGREFERESVYGVMHDRLPPELYAFLTPAGGEWDAPLQGGPLPAPPPPGADVFDLRRQPPPPQTRNDHVDDAFGEPVLGSNSWAVAGAHTVHGGALLANDMHLGLAVPNVWYRLSLIYPDERGGERRVSGVTLPGAPAIVVGSTGRIAWGLTNSYGDWSDWVLIEPDPENPTTYRTPTGPKPFEVFRETLRVRGGETETLDIRVTEWGPVIDKDHRGRERALHWVAHAPEAVNLELLRLEKAGSVDEALAIANRVGVPAQNILVADADGRIGWTLLGPIPRRFGFDGAIPQSWTDGAKGWDGWYAAADYPRIVDPPEGRLWSANARALDGEWLRRIGSHGYSLGIRAFQIRAALLARSGFGEADMLALQLDDRALFLTRWRDLLLGVLTPEALREDARRAELRRWVEQWSGRAGVDEVGYRLVRDFRLATARRVLDPLTAACARADDRFRYDVVSQQENPLWRLLTEQPPHLLDPRYPDWRALLLAAADQVIANVQESGAAWDRYIWGAVNLSQIRHPFSRVIPLAGRWLDMPAQPLPGDIYTPRVQGPSVGASERLVVSPGREAAGIFHMPGGQSGHPLSPHYRDGHAAWARGEASPFLPGPPTRVLRLRPPSALTKP